METKIKILKDTPCDVVGTVYSAPTIESLKMMIIANYPFLENYPDGYNFTSYIKKFYSRWFEIIEVSEYPKILEFQDVYDKFIFRLKDGKYLIWTLEDMLHEGDCVDSGDFIIKTVAKNENEVFTVGDKVKVIYDILEIMKFEYEDKHIFLCTKEGYKHDIINCTKVEEKKKEYNPNGKTMPLSNEKIGKKEEEKLMFGNYQVVFGKEDNYYEILFKENDYYAFVAPKDQFSAFIKAGMNLLEDKKEEKKCCYNCDNECKQIDYLHTYACDYWTEKNCEYKTSSNDFIAWYKKKGLELYKVEKINKLKELIKELH